MGLQLHRPVTALGLIIVAVFLAYANSFGNGWHYDDVHTITENPHIRSLEDPIGFFTDRTRFARDADKAMFRPLLVVTLASNYAWSELETGSYHVVNLLIHTACAMLLWVLLRQLGRGPSLALAGALLFGLHPLATEPVNYISARSESLSALFVLGAVVLHIRAGSQQIGPWRIASFLCYAMAMLSKETGITALGLIVAHDLTRRRFTLRDFADGLRPVHVVYGLLALVYLIVQYGHVSVAVVDAPVRDLSTQVMTQVKALVYYARLLVIPRGLNVHHQFFEGGLWSVIAFAGFAVASLVLVVGRGAADVRLGFGWCVIVLSPTLLVPLFILVNDHRLYLPIAGLLVALTSIWSAGSPYRWPARSRMGVVVAGLLVMGILTQNRNPAWADEYTLWSDAAAKSPQPLVPVAYVHLGNYAKEHGALEESVGYYGRALEIAPHHVAARNNLGLSLESMGLLAAAADTFASITRDHPDLPEGWYNLGHATQALAKAYGSQDPRYLDLLSTAHAAYGLVPDSSYHYDLALNNLGTTFEQAGRVDSAAVYYSRALALGGDSPDPGDNLRRLASQLDVYAGDMIDAGELIPLETLCEQISTLRGAPPEALFYLAVSRFLQGRYADSLTPNQALLEKHPGFILGYLQLGNLLETVGQTAEAHDVYERLLKRQAEGTYAEEARRRLQVDSKR